MEITIDDDSGTIIDNIIYSGAPNNNYGAFFQLQVTNISAYELSSLIDVDLSAISGNVVSSYFGLDKQVTVGPFYMEWNRILKPWIEGVHSGEASNDEPTWASQAHNVALWETAGCRGNADRQAIKEGSDTLTGTGPIQLPMSVATVQAWLDDSNNNHGIVIHAPNLVNGVHVYFRSSEGSSPKPSFYLEYTEGAAINYQNLMLMGVG